MQKKAVTLIFIITLLTTNLFSQTVKENIDKQIKDPKTAENAAKADVYVQKKIISDSVTIQRNDQSLVSKKNKRKKHCKKGSHSL